MPELTPSNPVAALVNLNLHAVALCNEGANSRAHILLTKRKENTSMSFEDFLKALNPEQAALVSGHIDELITAKDKAYSELTEKFNTLTTEVETLKKAKPAEPEDILKDVPPAVKAYVEKLQGAVNGFMVAQEETLVKERFAKVKALPVAEDELKPVLKSASPAVMGILEKAAAAIEAGLVAKGKDTQTEFAGETSDELYTKLEKAAKTVMEENAGMTFERAFTVACEKDAETYKKYVKGVK